MAIPLTDVQGLTATLAAAGTAVSSTAEIGTAISGGKAINCLQSVGDITSTINVQEYSCLSSDEIVKSLGTTTLGTLTMDLLYDALDAAGQADMRTMFAGKERRVLIIALSDDSGTTPTYITMDVAISAETCSLQKDAAVMFSNTVEMCSVPALTEATA